MLSVYRTNPQIKTYGRKCVDNKGMDLDQRVQTRGCGKGTPGQWGSWSEVHGAASRLPTSPACHLGLCVRGSPRCGESAGALAAETLARAPRAASFRGARPVLPPDCLEALAVTGVQPGESLPSLDQAAPGGRRRCCLVDAPRQTRTSLPCRCGRQEGSRRAAPPAREEASATKQTTTSRR